MLATSLQTTRAFASAGCLRADCVRAVARASITSDAPALLLPKRAPLAWMPCGLASGVGGWGRVVMNRGGAGDGMWSKGVGRHRGKGLRGGGGGESRAIGWSSSRGADKAVVRGRGRGGGVTSSEDRASVAAAAAAKAKRVKMQTPDEKAEAESTEKVARVKNPASRTSSTTRSQMTDKKFADLDISAKTRQAIADVLGYEHMTLVQEQTLAAALTGVDMLAKAKTGTGKTLAFLIPSIEQAAAAKAQGQWKIKVLVVSPTRELATQIYEEAASLCRFHDLRIQAIVGGTNLNKDIGGFKKNPDILVATPGRLNDHLQSGTLARHVDALQVLVFDEADQLLDMGFRPAIVEMLTHLPPKDSRQTLLFSATMPDDVSGIAKLAMRSEQFEFVDTVGAEDNTHAHVPQRVVTTSIDLQAHELWQQVTAARAAPGHKVVVFFTTARLTQFYAELFTLLGEPVLEMHSRLSQSRRTKVSDQFREGSNVVMFSSDVSARGLDYPDVSSVIQVGMPSDRAQYIHRLGRTARAGKGGMGVLVLNDFERGFLREVKDLPLEHCEALGDSHGASADRMQAALRKMNPITIATAYQAWMGYYNGALKRVGWNKTQLVAAANDMVLGAWQAPAVPALEPKTVGKMGLKGTPGLNVVHGAAGGRGAGGGGGGRTGGGRRADKKPGTAGEQGRKNGSGGGKPAPARTQWIDARALPLGDAAAAGRSEAKRAGSEARGRGGRGGGVSRGGRGGRGRAGGGRGRVA